ncbi:hypothetical protein H0H93_000008 [Arthromyces matolae]|nr:hypothetical protein H0H93_000008 [Arthromyces matolae]
MDSLSAPVRLQPISSRQVGGKETTNILENFIDDFQEHQDDQLPPYFKASLKPHSPSLDRHGPSPLILLSLLSFLRAMGNTIGESSTTADNVRIIGHLDTDESSFGTESPENMIVATEQQMLDLQSNRGLDTGTNPSGVEESSSSQEEEIFTSPSAADLSISSESSHSSFPLSDSEIPDNFDKSSTSDIVFSDTSNVNPESPPNKNEPEFVPDESNEPDERPFISPKQCTFMTEDPFAQLDSTVSIILSNSALNTAVSDAPLSCSSTQKPFEATVVMKLNADPNPQTSEDGRDSEVSMNRSVVAVTNVMSMCPIQESSTFKPGLVETVTLDIVRKGDDADPNPEKTEDVKFPPDSISSMLIVSQVINPSTSPESPQSLQYCGPTVVSIEEGVGLDVGPTKPEPHDDDETPSVRIRQDLPRLLTTYADATNLAFKYPELAKEILTHPLPTADKTQISSTSLARQVSSVPHHPDRPNWAAAPPETTNTQPISGTSNDSAAYVAPSTSRSRRHQGNKRTFTYDLPRGARRGGRGSFSNPRDRRHERPQQQNGTPGYDRPISTALIARLSSPPHINLESGDASKGTSASRQSPPDSFPAINRDALSAISSSGHPNVSIDQQTADEWGSTAADSWNDAPNATNSPPDDIYQQVPSNSGSDRTSRYVISSLTTDLQSGITPKRGPRRTHKQPGLDLNSATLRYLGKGLPTTKRESRRMPSLEREISDSDTTLEDKFSGSIVGSHHEGSPGGHFIPFRDIQTQTINSPNPRIIPLGHDHSKLPVLSKSQSQANPFVSNNDAANEWLPVRHTAEDWLLPGTSIPASAHISTPANEWFPVLPAAEDWLPKTSNRRESTALPLSFESYDDPANEWLPMQQNPDEWGPIVTKQFQGSQHSRSKPTSPGINQNPNTSYQFVQDHMNRSESTHQFTEPSAQGFSINGPRTAPNALGWTRRSRESLPGQAEAFSQHLAQNYTFSNNRGRGRKVGEHGARGSLAHRASFYCSTGDSNRT